MVGCQLPHMTDEHFEHSMEELASLTKTADGTVLTRITQKRNRADAATYIGKGKVDELKALCEELEADLVILMMNCHRASLNHSPLQLKRRSSTARGLFWIFSQKGEDERRKASDRIGPASIRAAASERTRNQSLKTRRRNRDERAR